ncbi:dihydrofolate reductase family protein [Micromonospora sp. A200]|uniref:dihydrofolate reductase family protein n=1 Tax=Micromonospora sp. A200 TaxID=2940568 RepID=UPI0032AEEFD2
MARGGAKSEDLRNHADVIVHRHGAVIACAVITIPGSRRGRARLHLDVQRAAEEPGLREWLAATALGRLYDTHPEITEVEATTAPDEHELIAALADLGFRQQPGERMRKLVYLVGVSLDGRIAGPGDELDFYHVGESLRDFITAEYPETLPGFARQAWGVDGAPNRRFDAAVMGGATYGAGLAQGISSPYPHLRQYVVSSTLSSPDPAVEITGGDVRRLARRLKAERGLDIWLCGGGRLAQQLIAEIDELVLKVYPVVAGAGVPLFGDRFSPAHFTLASARPLADGTVILTYHPAQEIS